MQNCGSFKQFRIRIAKFKACKYHRNPNQEYGLDLAVPKHMCPAAFHAAYPYCLALLYDARLSTHDRVGSSDRYSVRCPGCDNYIVLEIRKNRFLPKVLEGIKKICGRIITETLVPVDTIVYEMEMKVVDTKGCCPKQHKTGDKFKFNTSSRKEMCPAGFAAIYPFIRMLNDNPLYQQEVSSPILVSCPDKYNVVYELSISDIK